MNNSAKLMKQRVSLLAKKYRKLGLGKITFATVCSCDLCGEKEVHEREILSVWVDTDGYQSEQFLSSGLAHLISDDIHDLPGINDVQRERFVADPEPSKSKKRDWRYYKSRAVRRNKKQE